MKPKIFEIEYTQKSKEYYLNGETHIHFLNSNGELIDVIIDCMPDEETVDSIEWEKENEK